VTEVFAQFQGADATADPDSALAFLDRLENTSGVTRLRERTHRLLLDVINSFGSGTARRGVDVGCGAGRAAAELHRHALDAIGVDRSDLMLAAARHRYPNLTFLEAGAEELPFEDHSLDWYRAERLYLHLLDPAAALVEARRALSPGGIILLVDPILDSGTVDSDHPEIGRTIADAVIDACPNARAAMRSHADLAAAGFSDIAVHGHTFLTTDLAEAAPLTIDLSLATATALERITAAQADQWREDLERRARDGRFTAALAFAITVARAPFD
jgi:SAM-dependent methyltransferase